MIENLRCTRIAFIFAAIMLSVTLVAGLRASSADTPKLETILLGQSQLLSGSKASIRLITLNHVSGKPISGAVIRGYLGKSSIGNIDKPANRLFSGRTNRDGTLHASFILPDLADGTYDLMVTSQALGEKDTITEKVRIVRDQRILLTTDKPMYQPGQTMHIRALALRSPNLNALANAPLTIEVEDGKGNKVFKKTINTSEFGVASADFTLANEVNMGRYTVRALVDKTRTEKKITVDRYVLPKFKVKFTPDKSFYLPNETVTGKVQVDYFFGKPVANGKVSIKCATFDFQFKDFAEVSGRTDDSGAFKFEQKLPDYFVGQPLEQGNAFVKFDVTITDGADHQEKITQNVPVSAQALKIIAVPEGGRIVPNVQNTVYVMATYPDGTPAQAKVVIRPGSDKEVIGDWYDKPGWNPETDSSGIAEFKVTPSGEMLNLNMVATDKEKRTAETKVTIRGSSSEDSILLQTDKALAKVGQTVNITALSPAPKGSVYVDVIRAGQTLYTGSMDFSGGRADMLLPLSADMSGSLEIHAYRISKSGQIVRDTRLLYVNPADDLKIKISPDKQSYLPGKPAKIAFDVRDAQGRGVAAALGVSIVDESVFALQEMQPGMEKVYFLLEKELMEPKFEVHGLTPDRIIEPIYGKDFTPGQDKAARVLFSLSQQNDINSGARDSYSMTADSYTEKLAKIREELAKQVVVDYKKISSALKEYYAKASAKSLKDAGGIPHLVKAGVLKQEDIQDQWGREYDFTPCGCGSFQHSLTITSWGPDGKKDTDDDIAVGGSPGGNNEPQVLNLHPDPRMASLFRQDGFFEDFEFGIKGRVADGPMDALQAGAAFDKDDREFTKWKDEGVEVGLGYSSTGKLVGIPKMTETAKENVRIRQFFPETMYFNPAVITDGSGKASIDVNVADSITTWRVSATGSTTGGQLGSTSEGMKAFQDFFIDIDLPVSLTQNDEVSIPVAVYNYLPTAQTVSLEMTVEPWFELTGPATQKLQIGENDVEVVYYRIKVKQIGNHKLTVHAMGTKMSDAISREIEVVPDGKEFQTSINDRLEKTVEKKLVIPEGAIDGASNILVKVYPGIFSQVVEGMDKILQMPSGCFEQTSSTTYPNILVLNYMKGTSQITPEVQMKAEQYINLGYQRLVTFEVPGGGFSWFGDPPANKVLTAYGVMEFADMSKVYEVDQNLIQRTQRWLITQREKDGSWSPDKNYLHEDSWGKIQKSNLLPTAWITWSLLHSGIQPSELQSSIGYIQDNAKEAKDAYSAAMVANALVSAEPKGQATEEALRRLVDMKVEENGKVYWKSDVSTMCFTRGEGANVETTALATLALIRSGRYTDVVSKALTYIIQAKDANGTWGSTQATILALKALLASVEHQTQEITANVKVIVNGKEAGSFKITPEDSDVLRQIDCKQFVKEGENTIRIEFDGKGSSLYQISGKYFMPWDKLPKGSEDKLISIDIAFDRTELAKDDVITSTVNVSYNKPGSADMVMVDLGTPPGFQVMPEDFEKLVTDKVIQKFTVTGRQVILYFDKIENGKPVKFTYRMKAKFPIRARAPKSTAYLYYNPEINDVAPPVNMIVK